PNMGTSKTRKRGSDNRSGQARHKRILYLPMARSAADEITLPCRLSLEAIRQGRADSRCAHCVAQAVLLSGFLTQAGHGLLDSAVLNGAEREISTLLDHGRSTGEWRFPEALVDVLTEIINEYDRQLRETRLQAVLDASDRLERLI